MRSLSIQVKGVIPMVVLCWDPHIQRYVYVDTNSFPSFPTPVVYDECYRLFFPTCVFLEGEGWFVYDQGKLVPHDVFIRFAREHMVPVYPYPPWDTVPSAGNNDIYVIDRSHPLLSPRSDDHQNAVCVPARVPISPPPQSVVYVVHHVCSRCMELSQMYGGHQERVSLCCAHDSCHDREQEPPQYVHQYSHRPPMSGSLAFSIVSIVLALGIAFVFLSQTVFTSTPHVAHVAGDSQASLSSLVAHRTASSRPSVGDYRLRLPSSLTADEIDRILASYQSPASGTGYIWISVGTEYQIDPAYALAFFIHESVAGTHLQWAGRKPDGTTTHNVGNIICAGYPTCYGRFRDYASWEEGIRDWFRLIDTEYIRARGIPYVQEVIPIYAPAFENNVESYINHVCSLVDRWRSGIIP